MRHLFKLSPVMAALALLIGLTTTTAPAHAQENTVVPSNAVWGMTLDINKLWNSELGQTVERRIGQEADENLDQMLHGLSDMFGLDLRTDLGRIVVYGTGFQPQDAGAVIEIGQGETNLEGLLLAADGYNSYDYGEAIVHSFIPDNEAEEKRVYCAVSPGESGLVVMSHRKRSTEQLVDRVKAGRPLTTQNELQGDRFAHVWIHSIPAEMFEDGVQSNIASYITGLDLVANSGEKTSVALTVTTTTAARAKQVEQLINGGLAMVQLAASSDPDAAQLMELTQTLNVQRPAEQPTITLSWSIDTSEVNNLFNTLEKLDKKNKGHDHKKNHDHDEKLDLE